MNLRKLHRLKKNDTVAIVSLSWGGPSVFPVVYERGLDYIQNKLGLKTKEYPTARMDTKYLEDHPEVRAKDLNNAFVDDEVKAIFTSIGGSDSLRILKYLQPEVATRNPKILMGYSDTTISTVFYHLNGLVTFNGPAVMAGLAQAENLSEEYETSMSTFLFDDWNEFVYPQFSMFTDGYPDWKSVNRGDEIKELKKSDGWHWIQGKARTSGTLFGGCIEVLEFIKGTKYWPKSDFWKNKILFLETSEDKPSLTYVKYFLRNYGLMGVYDRISAVLFGIARDYSIEEKKQLDELILKVIRDEFGRKDLMVITNMNFGHTDPQIILPLGIKTEINTAKKQLKLLESPFSN